MMNTRIQGPPTTVQDPVCGMPVEPSQAVATRTLAGETFYFCSERCVAQFDREHAASATTGVAEMPGLRWIELPIADLTDRHSADYLVEQLKALSGVRQVQANPKARLVRVELSLIGSFRRTGFVFSFFLGLPQYSTSL